MANLTSRVSERVKLFAFPLTSGLAPARLEDILRTLNNDRSMSLRFDDWDKDLGAGTLFDLMAIVAIVRALKPKLCFEIGTGRGRTSLHLAINTDAEVLSLDIRSGGQRGEVYRDRPEASRIRELTANSKDFDFREWHKKVDFVLVDGAHDFDAVRKDTESAFNLVSAGGVIVWDDVTPGWPGVVKAVRNAPQRSQINRIVGTKLAYFHSPVTA